MKWLRELKNIFKPGNYYYITFSFKGLVVKRKFKLIEYDPKERLVIFKNPYGGMFKLLSTEDKPYIQVPEWKMYVQTSIFSEREGRLYLYIEDLTPPPPFVTREYVRVEVDQGNPVRVIVSAEGKTYEGYARDVSEKGIGVVFDRKDVGEEDIYIMKNTEELEAEILFPTGKVEAKLKLKHVTDIDKYKVLLGFSINVDKFNERELQKYIFERQREIAKELSSL